MFSAERVILDGTGADGAFGLHAKARSWARLYCMPQPILSASRRIYDKASMWRHNSRIEYWLRLLSRASDMPLPAAAIAQSPSQAHLYSTTGTKRTPVDSIEQWLSITMPIGDVGTRLSALDLALVCSDRYSQKNKCFFESSNRQIVYPFLDSRIVADSAHRGGTVARRGVAESYPKANIDPQFTP